VPAGSSAATGRATFAIDTQTNVLSYHVTVKNLEGAEQSAEIRGPTARGSAAAMLHSLSAGNPKVGIWIYDESIEADLLAGRTYVEVATDAHPAGEIRGQIEPNTAPPAAASLDLTLALWDGAPKIPTAVVRIEFEISAPDLTTITRSVTPGASPVMESFLTPRGAARRVAALAYDASSTLLYSTVAYIDVGGEERAVFLEMIPASDTAPPTGAGASAASAISGRTIAIEWARATDDTSPPEHLTYLIYLATTSGGQDFAAPIAASEPGALARTLTGLAAGSPYHMVVRAMDQAGNVDANLIEVSTTTLAAGAGLYVDVRNGSDDPTCGTATHPCRTITAALARTAGDEPIYVARGVYDEATGETFPLALQPGTRLVCESEWIGDPPGTRNTAVFMHKVLIRTTGLTSVLLGAPDVVIWAPVIELDPPSHSAGLGIDWNDSPIDVYRTWLAGPGDGVSQASGVRIGGDSLIDNCKVVGFNGIASRAISSYGVGNVIRHSLISNNAQGISGEGDLTVHHCIIEGHSAVAVGEFHLDFYRNAVRDNYTAIQHPAPGSRLVGNVIERTEGVAIRLWHPDETADPVTILNNTISRNRIGIEVVYRAGAIIRYNTIVCNTYADLATASPVLLDCRNNSWDHAPPTADQPDGDGLDGCEPGLDVCYALAYAGAPLPLLDPSFAGTCPLIAVVP